MTANNSKIRYFQFQTKALHLTAKEVKQMAKMGPEMDMYDAFIEKEIEQTGQLENVRGAMVYTDRFKVDKGTIYFAGQTFDTGRQIAHNLKKATAAVLFICTAGASISERSQALMQKGALLEGYLVDVIGSILVEKGIEKFHQQLIKEYQQELLSCSNRYSPGYCDWSVQDQSRLFSFFPDNCCDIQLSDSCLMHPIKSVSGVIGIGRDLSFQAYRCEFCKSKTCIYRKVQDKRVA